MGTRLQIMHERSRICRFAHTKLVTLNYNFSLIKKKKVEFSALSDAAGPEKQGIYLPRPNYSILRGLMS